MHYYGAYGGNVGYGMTPVLWPFALAGVIVTTIAVIIWLILVIWALRDLFKYKPAHKTAWAFVIIFGKIMGPIGYYFIVMKDRQKNMPPKPMAPTGPTSEVK